MDIARKLEDSSSPLLPLATFWRLDIHLGLSNLIPVCAESRSATFGVTLHHCPFGVIVGISEDLLEELVYCGLANNVGIFITGDALVRAKDVGSDTIPILAGYPARLIGSRWRTGCRECG